MNQLDQHKAPPYCFGQAAQMHRDGQWTSMALFSGSGWQAADAATNCL